VIGPEDVQLRDVAFYRMPGAGDGSGRGAGAAAPAGGNATPAAAFPLPGSTFPAASAAGAGALGTQLEEVERAAIVRALEQTRYNKTAAAKLLGMTFRALRYRIKKLGIE
jgi:two-component system response regulator PilR (NtrC family)